jgi:SpoVK/Ycf46/Vps4 family AAA+-type ATPase
MTPRAPLVPLAAGKCVAVRYKDAAFADLLPQLKRGAAAAQPTLICLHGLPRPQLATGAREIATLLGRPLMRFDAAALAGKYIGETEKNLDLLLSHASTAGAVLLFDEADALFGARSTGQDSAGRYANIEVSYLLARLEAFQGLLAMIFNSAAEAQRTRLRMRQLAVAWPPR